MSEAQSFWRETRYNSLDKSSRRLKLNDFVNEVTHIGENKKNIGCSECFNNMRSTRNSSKGLENATKKTDQRNFDEHFLNHLVTSIEELKSRVNYFENYFSYEVDRQKRKKKKLKQFHNMNQLGDNADVKSKLSTYLKKYTITPVLLSNSGDEEKKVESDSSLIKSSLSLTKNTYININPVLDSKHFKIAAQGFIKQAEELKNNINLILDTEQADNITLNDFENHLNCNDIGTHTEDCDSGLEQHLEYLLGSVTSQYEEILKLLANIQHQLKNVSKPKNSNPKLSLTTTKVSTYIPNNKYKGETFKSEVINTNSDPNLKNCKKKIKKLDPIVLVYEPIKPSDASQEVCNHCGRGSTSCVFGSCRNHLIKSEGYEKKQDVSCGFMVSYTPNINYISDNTETSKNSLSINSPLKKDSKEVKKRKKRCLWF